MTNSAAWDGAYAADVPPPWDIGRPQPRFEVVAMAGGLRGRVLDCGCGTGEHTLLAAAHGADAFGVDLSLRAIEQARGKAAARELDAHFEVADVLTMTPQTAPFDVVIDSGVFHVFDDADRVRYVAALERMTQPGSVCYLMCFSDRQPGDWGPRRVQESELRSAFADVWDIDVAPATFSTRPIDGATEVQAWFATIRRTR
jgi:SAM-dependent methyltransferase